MKTFIKKPIQKAIEPLLTTRWSQEYPYNKVGFEEGYHGADAMAGCVAVATAQTMKHYNWPEYGTGVLPPSSKGDYPGKDIDGFEYQWELMPDSIAVGSSEEAINSVSTIILDAGLSIKTGYGAGSNASSADLLTALPEYFGYDQNMTRCILLNSDYTHEEFSYLFKESISNGCPVIVSTEGHAVVAHGYTEDGTFIFNWGWGQMNENHKLDEININSAILNIRPKEPEILSGENIVSNQSALRPSDKGSIKFTVTNSSDTDYNGSFDVVLTDDHGIVRSVLAKDNPLNLPQNETHLVEVDILFDNGMTFGERQIQINYVPASGIPRPLRNVNDQILVHPVTTYRQNASDIVLKGDIITVSKIVEGENFDVSFTAFSHISTMANLAVYLVDGYLNTQFEIGSQNINFESGVDNTITISCSTVGVTPAKNYQVIITQKITHAKEPEFYPVICDEQGNTVSSTLYVQIADASYGTDVFMESSVDIGGKVYSESILPFTIDYRFAVATRRLFLITVGMMDANNNVLTSEIFNIIADNTDKKTLTGEMRATKTLYEDKPVKIFAKYINTYDGDGDGDGDNEYFMTPVDTSISNPVTTTVFALNPLDYVFLDGSVNPSEANVTSGQTFQISSSLINLPPSVNYPTFVVYISAIIRDAEGKEHSLSESVMQYGSFEQSIPFTLNCVVPDSISKGSYNCYIRGDKYAGIDGSVEKLPAINDSVDNEITLTVV